MNPENLFQFDDEGSSIDSVLEMPGMEITYWKEVVQRLPDPLLVLQSPDKPEPIFFNAAFNDNYRDYTSLIMSDLKRFFKLTPEMLLDGSAWVSVNLKRETGEMERLRAQLIPLGSSAGQDPVLVIINDEMRRGGGHSFSPPDEKLRALGQLAGGIAHDFNNQLMGIVGYAELLKDDLVLSEHKQYLDSMMRACERSTRLIGQLLDFSSQGKYRPVLFSAHEMIDEVMQLLRPSTSEHIRIEKNYNAELDAVFGDVSQLNNAVLNLLLNAVEALEGEGRIQIITSNIFIDDPSNLLFLSDSFQPGRFISIQVRDNGYGMDEQTLSRIFEPFFTTKGAGKGTGMGLAAVFGTVKNHGGAMRVDSRTGTGTMMSLYLPCDKNESNLEFCFEEPQMQKGEGTIMVIDDEPIVLDLLSDSLSSLGYQVHRFNGAAEAIQFFESEGTGVDLVLMDFLMPEMNGHELFLHLKKSNPSVKAYLLSGINKDAEVDTMLAEGILGYIQKPVSLLDLSWKVSSAVSSGNIESAAEKE